MLDVPAQVAQPASNAVLVCREPRYTDDTLLTIALTKSLLEMGRADAANAAHHYTYATCVWT
jgi:ADP-ribosylglycohydrolase